jgi:hypothetical protein
MLTTMSERNVCNSGIGGAGRSLQGAFEDYVSSHLDDIRRAYNLDPAAALTVRVLRQDGAPQRTTTVDGTVLDVPVTLATKVLASAQAFQWGNGVVVVPTMFALMKGGLISADASPGPTRLDDAARRLLGAGYERNLGNLRSALRLVALAGWVELTGRDERSSFALTQEGSHVARLIRKSWDGIARSVASLFRA